MRFLRSVYVMLVAAAAGFVQPAQPVRAEFYQGPQLFVMTGYIANTGTGVWGADYIVNGAWTHEKQQDRLAEWNKGLGKSYDADKTIAAFKKAGATGVIFYDKWHDGNVPHPTALTSFHTERDLVGLTLQALRKHGMKAVVYYSVGLDANPDPRFIDWTCLDPQGKRMGLAFENDWKSFYSPYRQYALNQMVEILKNYGPFDGFYLDLYTQPHGSRDKYTRQAFQARYGKAIEDATEKELQDFEVQTLSDYLGEIRKALTAVQPNIGFTWNGAGMNDVVHSKSAHAYDSQVDWFSMEGHSYSNIDRGARLGHGSDRPFDVGILLSSSWYVPMNDQAPPPTMSEEEAIVSAATAWIQGANVYAAMTPGHSGTFDEKGDLKLLEAIGGWLGDNKRWIVGATPYADIGILAGAPSAELHEIPSLIELWRGSHWGSAVDHDVPGGQVDLALRDAGYLTERVGGAFKGRPYDLSAYRMVVVPENALLDEATVAQTRKYVDDGGTLLAFGHSSLLDTNGVMRNDFALGDIFGVKYEGTLPGYKQFAALENSGIAEGMNLNPGALAVRANGGTVLAVWRNAADRPAIVENRFGKGRVIYTSAEEIAFGRGSKLLEELTASLIGAPAAHIKGQRQYVMQMNRKGDDLLLYVLNRSTGSRSYHGPSVMQSGETAGISSFKGPERVTVTLDTRALGNIAKARLIPTDEPVSVSKHGDTLELMFDALPSVTTIRLRK